MDYARGRLTRFKISDSQGFQSSLQRLVSTTIWEKRAVSLNHLFAGQVWPPQVTAQRLYGRGIPQQPRQAGRKLTRATESVPKSPRPSAQDTSKRTSNQSDTLCPALAPPHVTFWEKCFHRREPTLF